MYITSNTIITNASPPRRLFFYFILPIWFPQIVPRNNYDYLISISILDKHNIYPRRMYFRIHTTWLVRINFIYRNYYECTRPRNIHRTSQWTVAKLVRNASKTGEVVPYSGMKLFLKLNVNLRKCSGAILCLDSPSRLMHRDRETKRERANNHINLFAKICLC